MIKELKIKKTDSKSHLHPTKTNIVFYSQFYFI